MTHPIRSRCARWSRLARAAAALFVVASVAACDNGADLSAEDYLRRAMEHRDKRDIRASLIELRNAVRVAPDNGMARALLGQSYVDLGDPLAGEKELLRARDLGASQDLWLLPLARSWASQGKHANIIDEMPLEPSMPRGVQAQVHYAHGLARLGLNEIDKAEQAFTAASAADPEMVLPLIGLGRIAAGKGDFASAQAYLDKAEERIPDDREVVLFKANLKFAQADYAGAESAYAELAERYPQSPDIKIALAHARIAQNRAAEAIPDLEAVLKVLPRNLRATYLRALAAYQVADFPTAKAMSERILASLPDSVPTQLIAGGANYALGNFEQAASQLTAFLSSRPDNVPARRMLGLAYMRLGNPAAAFRVLQPIAEETADDAELQAMIGAAAIRAGDVRSGTEFLERATALAPESAVLRARLGAARVSLGDVDQGIEDLEKAIEQDPTLDRALISLALSHLRARDFESTLVAAERFRAIHPDSPVGDTLAGVAFAAKGDFTSAKAAFSRAMAVAPAAIDARINLAALEARENNVDEAIAILEQGLAEHGDNTRLLLRLAQMQMLAGRMDEAKTNLQTLVGAQPNTAAPKVLLSHILLRERSYDEALALAREADQLEPDNPETLEIIGRISMFKGSVETAIEALETLVKLRPRSAEAHFLLAQGYRAKQEAEYLDRFRQQLEKSVELDPNYRPARVQLAATLIEQAELERARTMLAKLKEETPDDAVVAELDAVMALRENRMEEAVAAFQRAVEARPTSNLVQRLAETQRLGGDIEGSHATLAKWIADNPDDANARFLLANIELERGDNAAALENYQKIIAVVPDSAIAQNNLAWLLLLDGRPNAALEHAERALQIAPEDPRIMDTAGLVYLELGETDRALHYLSNAARLQPENRNVQFHLARVHAVRGKIDEARAILRQVLLDEAAFSERSAAQALLNEIGN